MTVLIGPSPANRSVLQPSPPGNGQWSVDAKGLQEGGLVTGVGMFMVTNPPRLVHLLDFLEEEGLDQVAV